MDRKTQRLSLFILASCLSFPVFAKDFIQHNLGHWTQIEGQSSFLLYKPGVRKAALVNLNDKITTEGSYLSHDEGFMTGKFFDNCWIRLGPKTKIVFSFSPQEKILYLKVFTGSVKVLFNREWSKNKAEKLIIESGDRQLETESGKFVFIRRPLFQSNHLYVEKGVVGVVSESRVQTQFVHQNEKMTFGEKFSSPSSLAKMDDKEIKEISSNQYLRLLKQQM
jgi:hypothetical protein